MQPRWERLRPNVLLNECVKERTSFCAVAVDWPYPLTRARGPAARSGGGRTPEREYSTGGGGRRARGERCGAAAVSRGCKDHRRSAGEDAAGNRLLTKTVADNVVFATRFASGRASYYFPPQFCD